MYVRAADAETPPADSLFWHQLIGMTVVDSEGRLLGTVEEILQTGANDVYVVRSDVGGELLIPAIDEVVTAVDAVDGRITVRLLPGMAD